jgi:hypothetical protein
MGMLLAGLWHAMTMLYSCYSSQCSGFDVAMRVLSSCYNLAKNRIYSNKVARHLGGTLEALAWRLPARGCAIHGKIEKVMIVSFLVQIAFVGMDYLTLDGDWVVTGSRLGGVSVRNDSLPKWHLS